MHRDFSIFRPGSGFVGAFCAPIRRAFLPALAAVASAAAPLAGALGGGGKAEAPVSNTATFGNVSFGPKIIGDSALKAAPAIITAQESAPSWTKYLPWIVAGVVGLFAVILIPFGARRR